MTTKMALIQGLNSSLADQLRRLKTTNFLYDMPCHAKDTNPPRKSRYDLQTISFDDFYCLET